MDDKATMAMKKTYLGKGSIDLIGLDFWRIIIN